MIQVFQEAEETLRLYGDVQPAQLASGIWTALMTTAAGLTVAIPIFLGFKFLEGKIDRIVSELEFRSEGVVDRIADFSEGNLDLVEQVEVKPVLET
jgi:biopolymer transport protein ExbB